MNSKPLSSSYPPEDIVNKNRLHKVNLSVIAIIHISTVNLNDGKIHPDKVTQNQLMRHPYKVNQVVEINLKVQVNQ